MLAILLNEPDARKFANALAAAESARIAAPNWLEIVMKLDGMGAHNEAGYATANRILSEYTDRGILTIVAFTAEHTLHARQAFRQYGKGRHRAGLPRKGIALKTLRRHTDRDDAAGLNGIQPKPFALGQHLVGFGAGVQKQFVASTRRDVGQ